MAPRRNPGQKVDDLTAQVTRLYADAEQVILQRIASSLGRGMASPQWMENKLLELQLIQSRLRGEMAGLATKSASEITSVLTTAYNLGQGDALSELRNAGLGYAFKQGAVSGVNQLNALLQETTASVLAQHQRILRSVDDIYRQAISAATPLQLAGVITRKDAVQRALNTFADAGISGFTDRAGRKWNLTSYTDMATRTAARRAQVDGHANQLAAHDQNLVYVSDHAGECELCRPFEGKVLALVGDGTRTTLDEAKARGVFHPGCRHTIGLYLPGVSNLKHEPDPEGYAARQQQRGIERNIRKWKNRESVALDPATKAQARAKVRAHQAQMRDHLEKNPYLKRQPDRESLGWAQSRAKVGKAYPTPNRPFHPLPSARPSVAAPKTPLGKAAPAPKTTLDKARAEIAKLPADRQDFGRRLEVVPAAQMRQEAFRELERRMNGTRADVQARMESSFQKMSEAKAAMIRIEDEFGASRRTWPKKWPPEMLQFAKDHGVSRRGPSSAWDFLDQQRGIHNMDRMRATRHLGELDNLERTVWADAFRYLDDIDPLTGKLGKETAEHLATVKRVGALIQEEIEARVKARIGPVSGLDRRKITIDVLSDIRRMGKGDRPAYTYTPGTGAEAKIILKRELERAHEVYPTEWVDRNTAKFPKLELEVSGRGYNLDGTKISLSPRRGNDPFHAVAVHELGHSMEQSVPGLRGLEWAYHYERGAVQQADGTFKLGKATDLGYSSGWEELSVLDEWRERYTGKVYQGDSQGSWEVFTTGVESLMAGSRYFGDGGNFDTDFYRVMLGVFGGF